MNGSYTLQQAVEGWMSFAFTKPIACALVVKNRLAGQTARGHGNKAAKRAAVIETNSWFSMNELTEAEIETLAFIHGAK